MLDLKFGKYPWQIPPKSSKEKKKIPNIIHKLTANVSLHDPEITTFKKLKIHNYG
jgi:hypothetical protein